MRYRYVVGGKDNESELKIEIQVYKIKDGLNQIDIQKVMGGVLQYLDLCATLLDKLSAIAA